MSRTSKPFLGLEPARKADAAAGDRKGSRICLPREEGQQVAQGIRQQVSRHHLKVQGETSDSQQLFTAAKKYLMFP